MGNRNVLLFLCLMALAAEGQRRKSGGSGGYNSIERGQEVEDPPKPPAPSEDRRDIGSSFPYARGDTPIFHFEAESDEVFIETLNPLIKSVYHMRDMVKDQRGVTRGFGEAFAACEDCG